VDTLTIVNNVIGIVLFALLSTLIPREYLFIVVIVYVFAYTAILSTVQRLRFRKKISDVKEGPTLFKIDEKTSMDLVMKDQELVQELSKQMRGTFIMLIASIIIAFLVIPLISPIILGTDVQSFIEKFLRYFLFYTVMWGLMQGLRIAFMPKKMVIPVTKYEIKSTGIKYGGAYGSAWILFPLDQKRYKVAVNQKRGFIEIHDVKANQALRFYAEDIEKLRSLIEKYGLRR